MYKSSLVSLPTAPLRIVWVDNDRNNSDQMWLGKGNMSNHTSPQQEESGGSAQEQAAARRHCERQQTRHTHCVSEPCQEHTNHQLTLRRRDGHQIDYSCVSDNYSSAIGCYAVTLCQDVLFVCFIATNRFEQHVRTTSEFPDTGAIQERLRNFLRSCMSERVARVLKSEIQTQQNVGDDFFLCRETLIAASCSSEETAVQSRGIRNE